MPVPARLPACAAHAAQRCCHRHATSYHHNVESAPGDAAVHPAGSIYVLDYTGLPYADGQRADFIIPDDFEVGEYDESDGSSSKRALPRPIAFFKWTQPESGTGAGAGAGGGLMPVAIRVGQLEGSRVYTPADGAKGKLDWLFAKICVQIADFNCHEMQVRRLS